LGLCHRCVTISFTDSGIFNILQDAKHTDLKEYFGAFGVIKSINLKMDHATGRSRGFAFIMFKDVAGVEAALALTTHVIKGKMVVCRKVQRPANAYVGGLSEELSTEDLQAHFEQFGSLVKVGGGGRWTG
jgi:RNA recognition motif-containing protein